MATLEDALRNAGVDAITDKVDEGTTNPEGRVKIGTAGMALLLVTMPLNNPAYDAAASGVADLDIDPDVIADAIADGTAAAFEMENRDETKVISGSVGISGKDLNLNSISCETGVPVKITSGSVTLPAGSPT